MISSNVFAQGAPTETPGNFFFQICDFKEMKGGDWTRIIGCTKQPEGEAWKDATVFIIPGHSARAIRSIPEETQAVESMARARFTQKQLEPHGFTNFVTVSEGLEIGSRVLVVYVKSQEIDVEKIKRELMAELKKITDELSERLTKLEGKIPEDLKERLEKVESKLKNLRPYEFTLKPIALFLSTRAVLGGAVGMCYNASQYVDMCGSYGVGYEADYDKEPKQKFLAHFLEFGPSFNLYERILMLDMPFFYEADRNSMFYGHRDFIGVRPGLEWRFADFFAVEGFALLGTGIDVIEDKDNSRKFRAGAGASFVWYY